MAAILVASAVAGCGSRSSDSGSAYGSSTSGPTTAQATPQQLRVEVLGEIPWDPDTFTQGVEYDGPDRLLVSSGLYGRSNLRSVDPASGANVDMVPLEPGWFAEGVTVVTVGDERTLVLLTWRERVVAWFDPDTLTELRRAPYDTEGWGICQLDDGPVVTSDGSSRLTTRHADTLVATGSVDVVAGGRPVENLNELECDGTTVWANVWRTDRIVGVDVTTGRVVAEVDASGLLDRSANPGADVLNGIARVPGTDGEFLLTGKLWPTAFRVRFVPA
jgi:glutaminyl-peptide cyclotransferase